MARRRRGLFPVLNEKAAELFDNAKERFVFLLDQYPPEENAERAHIATQRQFLGRIGGVGGQFRQAAGLILFAPQGCVGHEVF